MRLGSHGPRVVRNATTMRSKHGPHKQTAAAIPHNIYKYYKMSRLTAWFGLWSLRLQQIVDYKLRTKSSNGPRVVRNATTMRSKHGPHKQTAAAIPPNIYKYYKMSRLTARCGL